jgi:dienelactone hydrolase
LHVDRTTGHALMTVVIQCPHCKHSFNVGDRFFGKRIKCAKCPGMIDIPDVALPVAEALRPPVQPPLPPKVAWPQSAAGPEREVVMAELVHDGPAAGSAPWPRPIEPPVAALAPSMSERVAPPRDVSTAIPMPGIVWLAVALLVAMAFVGFGLFFIPPHAAPTSMTLPTTPYALDDPVARCRAEAGTGTAEFPAQIPFLPGPPGVLVSIVRLEVGAGKPGYQGQLQIFKPAGSHAPKSLGCILGAPSGGTFMTAPERPLDVDQAEWLPYVLAGYAVVVFCQDGELVGNFANPSDAQVEKAARKFFAAQAGLVNGRNALEFVLGRMGEVDPQRIYVAGHSSAGTLAILFAEHENRIRGCIAYAPVTDVLKHYDRIANTSKVKLSGALRELLSRTSPSRHAAKLECPLWLFHAETDPVVPVDDSRAFVQTLKEHRKNAQLVTVPRGDHRGTVLAVGVPSAIEWLGDLENPGASAERQHRKAEATQPEETAAAKQMERAALQAETRRRDADYSRWLSTGEQLRAELAALVGPASFDSFTVTRVGHMADALAATAQSIAKSLPSSPADDQPARPDPLSPETHGKLAALNKALAAEKDRLHRLDARELTSSNLAARLELCVLPPWAVEERAPTPQEQAAYEQLLKKLDASRAADRRRRDFRSDAQWAMRLGKPRDAIRLLRAELLVGEEASLVKAVGWSPALRRPLALVEWSFGIELIGFPGTGPANLRPPAGQPQRNTSSEWRLGNQMKSLSGPIGAWIAEGLQARVDSGVFGDWGQDIPRGLFENRGITLLEFGPADLLVGSSKTAGTDVLMAMLLTMGHSASGSPSTTMIVQLYDVDRSEKLWESKPITSSRIVTARRQGKNVDADFAGEVLKFIDDEIVLRAMPELPPETMKRRLEAISAAKHADPLEALIEVRYYQATQRLADAEAHAQLARILGEENARLLVSDDQDDRRNAIAEFVPKGR